jgi:hypothetical protein
MQSLILRPNVRSLATVVMVLAAAAVLAFALLAGHGASVTMTRPAAPPAAPTLIDGAAAPADANPDSQLPICKKHGGPTC